VDSNVILRFLTGEPAELAAQASTLFQAVDNHELVLVIDEIVVAETVWVLQSFYGYSHKDVARVVRELLSHPGLEAEDKAGLLSALYLFAEKSVDFVDALLAVHMEQQGLIEIFSFDRHFDRLPGVTRLIPGQDNPKA
jgi:predicted nucleic-acid-binding protein